MRGAGQMHVGMRHGVVEGVEQVAFVGQAVEGADCLEDPPMVRPYPLEQHGDAAGLELFDDLAQRLGAGGVEGLHVGESQDHHPHVGDGGELGEEALGGAEEQRSVDAVDDDVVAQQPGLLAAVHQLVAGQRLTLRLAVDRDVPQSQERRDGDADLHGDDQIEGDGGNRRGQ